MKLNVLFYAAIALIAFTGPASAQVERIERIERFERKTIVRPAPAVPEDSEPAPVREQGFRPARLDDQQSFDVGGMALRRVSGLHRWPIFMTKRIMEEVCHGA